MGIVSYIQGKCITHRYEVKEERDCETGKLKSRPQLITHDDIVWKTLEREDGKEFVVDGDIGVSSPRTSVYRSGWVSVMDTAHHINLSETEEAVVEEKIYRADLHAYMVHTDKVIEEKEDEYNKYTKRNYKDLMCEYNAQMIEADEKLKAYCAVHKLEPKETDYDELKKVVYGESKLSGIQIDAITDCRFIDENTGYTVVNISL